MKRILNLLALVSCSAPATTAATPTHWAIPADMPCSSARG